MSSFKQLKWLLVPVVILLAAALSLDLAMANVELLYFDAQSGPSAITLEWETASEIDHLGFNIHRSETGDLDDAIKINGNTLIPCQVCNGPTGALYEWEDSAVQGNIVYTYWLESVDNYGNSEFSLPDTASLSGGSTIPTEPPPGNNTATPTRTPTPSPTVQPGDTAEATPTTTRPPANTSAPSATAAPALSSATPTRPAQSAPPAASPVGNQPNDSLPALPATGPGETVEPPAEEVAAGTGDSQDPVSVTSLGAPGNPPDTVAEVVTSARSATATAIAASPIGGNGQESAGDNQTSGQEGEWLNRSATVGLLVFISGVLLVLGGGATTWYWLSRRKS
ncbi:MAG: hypothetical protein L0332_31370 [Chloroflexi bacterium]|nr:hypothetical protein [Chloroflexota bacterium]MCI0576319.1 hypothetical protein [Chloroflexota bacterium]MCI0650118.1 hypothetical protein [Chloroflexota bacterium]MCI0731202.1 hypothetical protein [Chloroflexota bacterium]